MSRAELPHVQEELNGLVDSSGTQVVTYVYNNQGDRLPGSTISTPASLNPFCYRGYCYDEETGLYYLGSGYYDPEVGRFISADTTDVLIAAYNALTDKNLYAYCDNNPVVRIDRGGNFWETIFDVILLDRVLLKFV